MKRSLISVLAVTSFCTLTSQTHAQTGPRTDAGRAEPLFADSANRSAAQFTHPPGQHRGLVQISPGVYVVPAPYSPDYWSPTYRPEYDYNPDSRFGLRHRRSSPRRFRRGYGRDRTYRGYGDRYGGGYGYGGYRRDLGGAYRQGHYDAMHDYVWYIAAARAGRLLNQYREMFDEALVMFHYGQYDWAAIKLLGAADKNHTSAAARLHAGHALFALGRYDEATHLIARAHELSPSLAHKKYDLRDEYGDRADFRRHLKKLDSYVGKHPDEAGAMTLLGYVTYHSEGPGAAYPYLDRAARLDRDSYFIPKLLTLARVASGMEKKPAEKEPAQQKQIQKKPAEKEPTDLRKKARDTKRVGTPPFRRV